MKILLIFIICNVTCVFSFLPPKFQWKILDYAWEGNVRQSALATGAFIPENNIPAGIAKWKNKLFVTIPRWKKGVPASLNYVHVNGSQTQPLHPYPSWNEAFVSQNACCISGNTTVVSTFRVHIDQCDRLWVVDNGVTDMLENIRQVTPPAILVFDLNTDRLLYRHVFDEEVLRDSSVLNSVVVDSIGRDCEESYAYISDMGSNAILVYSLREDMTWRVDNHFFHFDPLSGVYNVGGVDFYWSDGVSSLVLTPLKRNGHRDLYFHPTSSTKQFRMPVQLLRNKHVPKENLFTGVEVVGDRGRLSQATAVDYDAKNNVIFYTQWEMLCAARLSARRKQGTIGLSTGTSVIRLTNIKNMQLNKNGVSCWNLDKPLNEENAPTIISDCTMLEFPNDIQVHQDDLWILSNRQSRFLYGSMDFSQVNFRVMTAPTANLVQGTPCEKSIMSKAFSYVKRPKSDNKNV